MTPLFVPKPVAPKRAPEADKRPEAESEPAPEEESDFLI